MYMQSVAPQRLFTFAMLFFVLTTAATGVTITHEFVVTRDRSKALHVLSHYARVNSMADATEVGLGSGLLGLGLGGTPHHISIAINIIVGL